MMGEVKASLILLNGYYLFVLVSAFVGIQGIFLCEETHNTYFLYYIKCLSGTTN